MGVGHHLRGLGNSISVTLPKDSEGYIDRECPEAACSGFFKVKSGTGLSNSDWCICPYCGHKGPSAEFYSRSQVSYAKAVAKRKVEDALGAELEAMARRFPRGGMVSMSVKRGPRTPTVYAHRPLPTALRCESCTCEFKVSGDEGRCPDCGKVVGR